MDYSEAVTVCGGNAVVAICSTIVTLVGKGTLHYNIKIIRIEISTIAPADTLVTLLLQPLIGDFERQTV